MWDGSPTAFLIIIASPQSIYSAAHQITTAIFVIYNRQVVAKYRYSVLGGVARVRRSAERSAVG
jgi:hypothetical protein